VQQHQTHGHEQRTDTEENGPPACPDRPCHVPEARSAGRIGWTGGRVPHHQVPAQRLHLHHSLLFPEGQQHTLLAVYQILRLLVLRASAYRRADPLREPDTLVAAWGVRTGLAWAWPDRAIYGGQVKLARMGEAIALRFRIPLVWSYAGV
jgi:hypothetical protein